MASIKNLNLSPETYTLLIDNGIKTVEGLSRFSIQELQSLKIVQNYNNITRKLPNMLEEIQEKLKTYDFSKEKQEVFDSEKRVQELNIPGFVVERLRRNRVVTKGILSTLDERDFSMMYRIGKKAQTDIKNGLNIKDDKIEKTDYTEMIFKGLSEEEIKYYHNQVSKVKENSEKEKQEEEKERKLKEEKLYRKWVLLGTKLADLYIPKPIFRDNEVIEEPTLNDILFKQKERILNHLEIENALSNLNIPHLHLGMTAIDNYKLEITELDLKRVEEYKLERHIEELRVIEKIYETRIQNEKLKEIIEDKENMVKVLEKVLSEKEELERQNNELTSRLNELSKKTGIEENQGQHRK